MTEEAKVMEENPEAAEHDTEQPEKNEAGEQAPAADDAKSEEQPKRRKAGGFQKRIKKLVAQKHELKDRLKRAEQELAALKEPPREDDFDSDADFIAAKVEHLTDKKLLEREASQVKSEVENLTSEAENEKLSVYNDIMRDGIERHQDYLQKVTTCPLPDHVAEAVLDTEDPAEVFYYIGSNPLEALDLANMAPGEVASKLQEIAGKVTGTNDNKPAPTVPMDEPRASAPGAAETTLRDDIPMDEWIKRRNAQVNNSR